MKTKLNDIVIRVKKVEDLFYKSVIPLSCRRLLHPDVEGYIIEEAEKLKSFSDIRITIHVEEVQYVSIR